MLTPPKAKFSTAATRMRSSRGCRVWRTIAQRGSSSSRFAVGTIRPLLHLQQREDRLECAAGHHRGPCAL